MTSDDPTKAVTTDDERLGDAIRDIAGRVPRYAKLSASLSRAGAMEARSRSPLTQTLGEGGFGRLTQWIPQLRQLDRSLRSIGAIRSALGEMQSDRAQRHLEDAGLTREQIERDYRTLTWIGSRLSDEVARNARALLYGGAHHAGKLTGKGLRLFKRWKKQWDET
jgi:uncharacterized protein YjiS (DUF1127 family)